MIHTIPKKASYKKYISIIKLCGTWYVKLAIEDQAFVLSSCWSRLHAKFMAKILTEAIYDLVNIEMNKSLNTNREYKPIEAARKYIKVITISGEWRIVLRVRSRLFVFIHTGKRNIVMAEANTLAKSIKRLIEIKSIIPDNIIDLRKCKPGDELTSCHGKKLTYVKHYPNETYPHHIAFPDYGYGFGTRLDNGNVYSNKRMDCDHDIVEVYRNGQLLQKAKRIPLISMKKTKHNKGKTHV
jgi:hypothetical protein